MFLPIGDTPNPRTTPWVTYGLIAANVRLSDKVLGDLEAQIAAQHAAEEAARKKK